MAARQFDRVRPSRPRELTAGFSADDGARFANQSLGEHTAQPRDKHRANRQVRRVGRQRRANEHVFGARNDPRVAADDRERFRRGARLRDEIGELKKELRGMDVAGVGR